MSGTGFNAADLVPLPEKTHAVTNPDKEEKEFALADGPTASHALATGELEEKGLAQQDHEGPEVKDLGWNERKDKVPSPLVGGLGNEELWMLIRRFNMQTYHVVETTSPAPGNLDLNVADEDEFSPDKLRSTIERLYMTVIIGVIGLVKHILRLRSWREKRRTTMFAGAYFLAWMFDLLVPTIALVLISLIAFPPSRAFLFPPAPIALVGKDGGVQKPRAGVLGSHDSATGAPEHHKGEALEAEASNFVNSITHVALSSAVGKHPADAPPSETEDASHDTVPDPSAMALGAASARQNAAGVNVLKEHDKTKVPMETAMWTRMRPAMHALGDVIDTWERFGNALSPTPPFPQEPFRLRIAALMVPLLATSLMVTSYMFMKGVTFGIGFGFFGDPVISRALHWLNQTYPDWEKLLEMRNTVLKGVPTNAQLTITLLRSAEARRAPLPPPPRVGDAPPPDAIAHFDETHLTSVGGDAPLGATEAEILEAMSPSAQHDASSTSADVNSAKMHEHGRKGSKILGFFRGSVKASVETALSADYVKATAGSATSKNRLGVVPKPSLTLLTGPVDFKARYHGRKGHVYISTRATIPCVSFTTDSTVEKIGTQDREDLHPVWSVAIADVTGIKKVGGFGWKAKLLVGWALERTVADGLEITDRDGAVWKVTALPLRNELFNRLISMGGQQWVLR